MIEAQDDDLIISEDEIDEFVQEKYDNEDPDAFFARSAFRVVYQTNNFFLPQVRDMIAKGDAINIRPEYQRRLRWSRQQKSRLIESLLLNVPVPPVFFYENAAARYEVMDGQQRLNAIQEFFSGDFALSGLTALEPLNGLRYTRCPPRIKRALDRATLSAIVLLLESETDSNHGTSSVKDIRRFVFDRLNTGGRRLNAQEIRNAIYPGPLNELLVQLSRYPAFTNAFGIPPYTEADPSDYYENPVRQKNTLYATMRDCELVLRFFALREPDNIRGAMKAMLDRTMDRGIDEDEVGPNAERFVSRLNLLTTLFGDDIFLLPEDSRGKRRVSAALYDASMVAIDQLWEFKDTILNDRDNVFQRLEDAFNREDDLEHLVGRGNTADAIRARIVIMRHVFMPDEP